MGYLDNSQRIEGIVVRACEHMTILQMMMIAINGTTGDDHDNDNDDDDCVVYDALFYAIT